MLNTYKTILSKKIRLTSDVYLYHFDLLEPKEIKFSAGQYLMIKIPINKGMVSRLYSIASSSLEKNSFELIIQIISSGLASNHLSNLKVKDEVVFQGPAGMFRLKENDRPKIFLATGTGIAPVRSMLESYQLPVTSYKLFWGLKKYKDIYLFNELKEFNPKICLSREQNLKMIPDKDRKYFEMGHINECLEKQLTINNQQLTIFDFYLCGRREVVELLRLFLIKKGIMRENIYFEKF